LLNQGSDAINGLETGFTQLSAERMAAFNDSMAQLGEKFRIVAIQVMEALLPALQTLVHLLDGLAKIFNAIPGPIKQLAVTFGVLTIAVKALGLAAVLTQGALQGIAATKLPALLGGWVGSMGPVVAAFAGIVAKIKAVGLIVAAVFTGPAAPFILAGAAVVGLIAAFVKFKFLREIFADLGKQIAQLATNIGKGFADLFKNIVKAGGSFIQAFGTRWRRVKDIMIAPFKAAIEFIPTQIRKMIDSVTNAIQNWWKKIMSIIRRGRKAASSSSSSSSGGSVQGYAEGGYVQGPQLAVVGEGKSSEYIVPSHKMGGFINNYLSGMRGGAAIPRFAEGGFVSGGSPNINIKTGPVMQMSNGQQYVTVNDLQAALSSFSASVFSNSRTAGGRRFQGIS
jgi:hypothetical protein